MSITIKLDNNEDIRNLMNIFNAYRSTIVDVEGPSRDYEGEIKNLQNTIEDLKSMLRDCRNEFKILAEENEDLENKVDDGYGYWDEEVEEVEDLSNRITNLEHQMNALTELLQTIVGRKRHRSHRSLKEQFKTNMVNDDGGMI